MKKPIHIGDAPPKMDDAGETIVKTPTTAEANEIRDRQYSTHGDKSAGVVKTKGRTPWSQAERDRLTGEADRSLTKR